MILVFDTETTTFPSKTLSPTDPNQARIMQLAWLALSDDFEEVGCYNSLIKLPASVNISEGAQNAHGISREDCDKYGVDIGSALCIFNQIYDRAKLVIAHNIKFDSQLIDIETAILNRPQVYAWISPKHFCTMEAMTPICKLGFNGGKPKFGSKQYKWTKLQEAYTFCTGKEFEGAHDALADVRATAKVYKWLREQNYAK